jgi:aspartate/methionine/tyrosine aminotransferase
MSLGRYAYPMYKPNIEKAKGVHIGINSSDPFNPIPSPADIEQEIDKFLSENPNKKVVLIIQTENPFGCSPTEDWAKDVAGVMQKIWDKHGKNSLFGIGDGIYDGLAEDGKYYDVASYLNNLEAFVKIKSGAKTFGNAGGLRLGAIFTENQEFAKIFAEQQFIEFLSTNNEGQVALVKIMELETNPIEIAKVSKYFEENTALCKELGQNMSKSLQLQKGMFEQYQKMEQNGTYRKGGFYLWGDLTEAVSGLAIPPQLQKIAGSDTVNCATTFTRLLLNGHLMEGVRKSVLTTPIEDFIVNPKDLVEPSTGKFRIEGRFSTSAKRETFKDSFESIERTICKLLEYNISNHPEKVPEFAKNPQVQDHIKEVISRTKELDAKIAADPTLNALQKRMIAETEQAMNSTPWKTAPHMLVQNSAAIATNRNQAAFRGVAR